MKKTENIAIQNKNEAQGNCLACNRPGIPVFLLRKAVIKIKSMQTDGINPIFQELADYTKTLDFKNRMPDEQLNGFDYILRTLRNGYVYVMQQQGDDINSRIFQVYECIDGALRQKNIYDLTNTEPRPLSKACKDACHYIPASFISLQPQFTQAWVAYTSQPWNPKTIEDYLKEQDHTVLSRFTKIDIKKLKDTPSEATGNRAVPFKDIFGFSHEDPANDKSKVLEFRFDDQGLNDFESAHRFTSFKKERKRFALHANLLYKGYKPISCGVVLEDTFGIAEELNTQRVKNLSLFHNQAQRFADDEIKIDDDFNAGFDIDKQNKIFEQRAQSMLKMINPVLQRRFKYYQPIMFKKRIILQLIEQYRFSVETSYDREIAKVKEEIDSVKNSGNDIVGYNGIPQSTSMHYKIGKLSQDKAKALNDFDSLVDQSKVSSFKKELQSAYQELVDYHKEWSEDYYTYLRWLFGKKGIVSQYSGKPPKNVNSIHFWKREFDFSNETMKIIHASEVTSILLDSTHSEIKFEQDSALWDELLSNPESIYYIIDYNNPKGIDRDEKVYVDFTGQQLFNPKELISKSTNIATIYNTYQEKKNKEDLNNKKKILEENKEKIKIEIKQNQQKIEEFKEKRQKIPANDPVVREKLTQVKKEHESKLRQLNKDLESINQELSKISKPNQQATVSAENGDSPLNRTALKKQAVLVQNKLHSPIESHWMKLNAFDQLAKLGVLPVEIHVQIRPDNLGKIQNLLTQMHRGFYNRGIYHPHEREFLESFDIEEKTTKIGTTKTKQVKFTLCFPDKESEALFIAFINRTNGTLNPHNLKQFIEQEYQSYFKLIYKKQMIVNEIDKVNKSKNAATEILNKTSNSNIDKAKTQINEKISKVEDIIIEDQDKLDKINNQIELEKSKGNVKVGKKTFALNLAVSAISGFITLKDIFETLKEWDKAKEGNGELYQKAQFVKDAVTLALMGIDLTSQYKNIKLNMQLGEAINAGRDMTKIKAKLRLNTLISKTVARGLAAITILEAVGELKSSFDMVNMENKIYFISRLSGSIALGASTIIILIGGSLFTVIFGVALVIGGTIAIMFSKKYDNFTAIQHWLNRCCFGVHEEMAYLGYSAYHEDDYSSHSGFGLALNDYAVMMYNTQTFINIKQLYHSPRDTTDADAANVFQRHVYFYLNIPDFSKYNQNESAIAMIRLFINDFSNLKSEPDPLIEKYIDFKYRITPQKIKLLAINTNYGNLNLIWTDKKAYFDKYDREIDILTGQPKSEYIPIIEPVEFTLNTLANKITSKAITNAEQPISNGLIINKWIAGTIGAINILKYQIMIQYHNREEVPLIITKKGKL